LFSEEIQKQSFTSLRSIKQQIYQTERISFSPVNFSRFYLGKFGIESLPFGSKHMSSEEMELMENELKWDNLNLSLTHFHITILYEALIVITKYVKYFH